MDMSKRYLIKESSTRKVYIENVGGKWQLVIRYAGSEMDVITPNPTFREVEDEVENATELMEDMEVILK